jgi:hypothetical protein
MFPMHARKFSRYLTGAARRADRHHSQCLQGVQTGSYIATTVQCQHYGPLICHSYSVNRLDSTRGTLLTEYSVTGDKTKRAYIVKDIICYS